MSFSHRVRTALRDPQAASLAVRRRLAARIAPPEPADAPSPVESAPPPPTSAEVLQAVGAQLDTAGRVALTVSCRDADALPKVEGAGQVFDGPHGPVQRMHNGVEVPHLGYFGDWMAEIIERLDGHHEPQEELVFARLLERIERHDPVIVELGCFWAYYSCWFLRQHPGGTAVACEPDPEHLDVGRETAKINGVDVRFEHAAAGSSDDEVLELPSWNHPGVVHRVPVRTVPTLLADHDLDHIDVLHLDIQGAELAVLESCRRLIAEGRIRFVVVSTHHHTISGDPVTHQRCIDFVRELGGHVIAEHTVLESFSGDGLMVASFDERDRGFHVALSRARTTEALFPSGEQELERFRLAYDELRARLA
ncbi:MAG TPA: FkbM family methyltransferase [Acidimicrobiales bacterium]|nr:FkbM family methyltransferase [Acidimicrobiales bacterium]